MHRLLNVLDSIWLWVVQDMPGSLGFRLRSGYWRRRLKYLGTHARIDCGVYFQSPEFISIDDNSWIDRGVMILAGRDRSTRKIRKWAVRTLAGDGEVHIGRNVHIGAFSIISGIEGGVHIGDDCTFSPAVKVYAFSHHYRFEDDPANRSVAYLEKYAPELRENIEQARLGKADPMPTKLRNSLRLVARAGEDKWHAANSAEGQKIMTTWNVAGADGNYPVVCSP